MATTAAAGTTGSDPQAVRRAAIELVVVSFIVLFQELALIRWLPGQVRVAAYFPNLVLISAFLGLGLGSLRARRASLLWTWPVSLLALVAGALWASGIAFTSNPETEHLWLLYADLPEGARVVDGVRLPIVAFFVLSATSFVALGQVVAARLLALRDSLGALRGYALDLTGSLLGVTAFALAALLLSAPWVWFTTFLLAGLVLFRGRRRSGALYVACAAAVLTLVVVGERASYYSPYYALSVRDLGEGALAVETNGSLHQVALPMRRGDGGSNPLHTQVRAGYHLPFRYLDAPPKRALVLGAGTGNDVAVLLDEGVERVDAVEIDPVILDIGRIAHPNRPYDSERVRVFNTDARSFLNHGTELYDLIVFGTLDSMTRLSALSNVRLDNFVYTQESIDAARARLAPGGGMALYFMSSTSYIDDHLAAMLTRAFGTPPALHANYYQLFNRLYLTGDAFAHVGAEPGWSRPDGAAAAVVPSDDWPFLYLAERTVTPFYLSLIAIFLALAVAGIFAASPEMRASLGTRGGVDAEMFLFGLAFLLLETHFVTAINLVWGATWLTSAVVFGSILAMVLMATLLTHVRPLTYRLAATGLVGSLLVAYFIPVDALLLANPLARLAASVLYVGVPIFFAAVCFAVRFNTRSAVDVAFGWNLLGAVAGGLLEFLGMATGLKALTLVAVAAYLLAFALAARRGDPTPVPPAPTPRSAAPEPLPAGG
ncbi:MAG: hypothetical protein WEB88_06655 [Gemmatimonadota bacterium]